MNAIFYDPHPGLAGCPTPLPESVKIVADWLDGKVMEPQEAAALIREAAAPLDAACCVQTHGDYISLGMGRFNSRGGFPLYRNNWRVIRYLEEEPTP